MVRGSPRTPTLGATSGRTIPGRNMPRRTTPRVRDGRVQRKNSTRRTLDYFHDTMPWLVVDRERPGPGCTHVARCEEVRRFVQLLPDWPTLSQGLNAIVLARVDNCMGWHRPGVVAICAWERELAWPDCDLNFFDEHREVLDKLGVPYDVHWDRVVVHFTMDTAKAFQLVHVLVHELGHHHDRMTTRRRRDCGRGEAYAERYARRFEDEIIRRYRREFAL